MHRRRQRARIRRVPGTGGAIDLVGRHGIEGLGNGDHACAEGEVVALERVAGAGAVVPGGHILDDFQDPGLGACTTKDFDAHLS